MTAIQLVSKNPIVRKIADGEAKEDIFDLLMAKQLPFTEEEYLESLVFAMNTDTVKSQALEHLKAISESTKSGYLEKIRANHRVAFYILLEALGWKNSALIAKVVKNQALPHGFLLKIAEKGNEAMMEMLLDNQIKLIAYPEIMEVMEKNPAITKFIQGRIDSLREYYLTKESAEEIAAEDVLEDVRETLTLEQKKAAESGEEEDDGEDQDSLDSLDLIEEKALTTLQEINNMTISERVKLAMTGTKTHRMILIKDNNKMVSLAVLECPKISPDEISILAKNKSLPGELVAKIARNREWTKNYSIALELVKNPKTPIKDALSFINKLHIRDLRGVSKDKNMNPVIRNLAVNLFSQKSGVKR
ncbi:MAG: hypothetical protein GY940_29820 [bacterium]|nr:hypothetical protein [bacterium]